MKTRNFDSLESFANALGQNVLRARIAEPLLDAIGETVSQRAAAKLGTYQGSSGPFDRWKQLLCNWLCSFFPIFKYKVYKIIK